MQSDRYVASEKNVEKPLDNLQQKCYNRITKGKGTDRSPTNCPPLGFQEQKELE